MLVDQDAEVLSEVFRILEPLRSPRAVPESPEQRRDVLGHGQRHPGVRAHSREGNRDGGVPEAGHGVLQRVPLRHRLVTRESRDGVPVRLAVRHALELPLGKVHLERVVDGDAVREGLAHRVHDLPNAVDALARRGRQPEKVRRTRVEVEAVSDESVRGATRDVVRLGDGDGESVPAEERSAGETADAGADDDDVDLVGKLVALPTGTLAELDVRVIFRASDDRGRRRRGGGGGGGGRPGGDDARGAARLGRCAVKARRSCRR